MAGRAPPDYTDPIVLRLRFVPRRKEAFVPTHVASAKAWDGYVTDAQMWDALRMAGYGPEAPSSTTPASATETASAEYDPDRATEAHVHVVPIQEPFIEPQKSSWSVFRACRKGGGEGHAELGTRQAPSRRRHAGNIRKAPHERQIPRGRLDEGSRPTRRVQQIKEILPWLSESERTL